MRGRGGTRQIAAVQTIPVVRPVGVIQADVVGQTARTPVACGPLGLCPTSNSTFWFSSKVRNPDPLDFRVVDEHIGGAVLRGDEAEALLRVEPLHSSLWHFRTFFTSCGNGPPIFRIDRAGSDRHPSWNRRVDRTEDPRRNRDRNVDPAK